MPYTYSLPSLKLKHSLLFLSLLITVFLTACQDNRKPGLASSAAVTSVQTASSSSGAATRQLQPKGFEQRSSSIGSELPTQSQVSSARAAKLKYNAGEDPEFARRKGWPKKYPTPLQGAIIPQKRIVAYYGNPLSKRMGALGEFPKDEMIKRLKLEVAKWEKADPGVPVQPALHLIAVVAQGAPGKAGKYRLIMTNDLINQVYGWAKEAGAVLFIDIQTGHDDIRAILPQFEWILKNPDVHLGIDPEFNLISSKVKPGKKIGTYDAADINYASSYLKDLVQKYKLPPKVFTVHRFTRNGVTNADKIVLRREVQIVMHMDGWGAPWLKRDSYKDYIVAEPVQFTGFKLFYHNDTKKGDPLMTPQDLLKLNPKPIYIQYQ
ncbi:hypothetical protein [Trichlorobacter lovleyi]|uniref:hypothetical protein n=1 Tax=Trichlorobacter lovleyi TaxID=313985 RepID=UPI0023EF69FA|nr:hypothetical protein [Trichlorobacter lovleyi]